MGGGGEGEVAEECFLGLMQIKHSCDFRKLLKLINTITKFEATGGYSPPVAFAASLAVAVPVRPGPCSDFQAEPVSRGKENFPS